MNMDMMTLFSERLKALREKAGLNQSQLAEKLGVSRGSISFYENGDRIPDIVFLHGVAELFQVSADWLIGLSDTKTVDADLKAVCEYTGLSEEAISYILEADELKKSLLSQIISSDDFNLLMYCIGNLCYQMIYLEELYSENLLIDFDRQLMKNEYILKAYHQLNVVFGLKYPEEVLDEGLDTAKTYLDNLIRGITGYNDFLNKLDEKLPPEHKDRAKTLSESIRQIRFFRDY